MLSFKAFIVVIWLLFPFLSGTLFFFFKKYISISELMIYFLFGHL